MKSLFRWMRGELNGFYINAVRDAAERTAGAMLTFLAQFAGMSMLDWHTVPSDVIQGFGMLSGVMLPYVVSTTNRQAFFMTGPYAPQGIQRSERGIFNRAQEIFRFRHVEDESYPDDINTFADNIGGTERSSLVGDEVVLGYIRNSETDVIRDDGTVDPDKVLQSEPQDGYSTPFYGNGFLMLGSSDRLPLLPTDALYLALIRAMQRVRYNGPSMKSLLDIAGIICPEKYIKIGTLTRSGAPGRFNVTYRVIGGDDDRNLLQKIFLFRHVVSQKFPQITLEELLNN